MEDSWFLSTPMSLNANTPTLGMKYTKTQRELFTVVEELTNILEHFRKSQSNKKKTDATESAN